MYRLRTLRLGAYNLLWGGVLIVLLLTTTMWLNCNNRRDSSSGIYSGDGIYELHVPLDKSKRYSEDSETVYNSNSKNRRGAETRLNDYVRGQDSVLKDAESNEDYDDVADVPEHVEAEIPESGISKAGNVVEVLGDAGFQQRRGNIPPSQSDVRISSPVIEEEPVMLNAQGLGNGNLGTGQTLGNDGQELGSEGQGLSNEGQSGIRGVNCHINDEYRINCLREDHEVYIPFSFISKHFEINGKLIEEGGVEHFDWQHSSALVYQPTEKYRVDGIFMSFEHYNVEVRERVKCISGAEGVPVSTQWGAQGYFYSIQIAQYGLSHYSKYIMEQKSKRSQVGGTKNHQAVEAWLQQPERAGLEYQMICDGQVDSIKQWEIRGEGVVRSEKERDTGASVTYFQSTGRSEQPDITLPLTVGPRLEDDVPTNEGLPIISFTVRFTSNGSVTVVVEVEVRHPASPTLSLRVFEIHYVMSSVMIQVSSNRIYYGIGSNISTWRTFTRDVNTDLQKGILQKYAKHRRKAARVSLRRMVHLDLRGAGYIANISMSRTAHLAQFYAAADWLVDQQDSRGGWPINVTRRLAEGMLDLSPGWYSAMAQGQSLSVLTRAFLQTKDSRYLYAALNAVELFDVPVDRGGVLTNFAGRYPWYEEYPTSPSSFVLNGFIYSLIGLYDLKEVAAGTEGGRKAERLYRVGMTSLRGLLALFDTGSGSVYDLRHFSLSGVAPNIARWDYHATHINQLLLLATIDTGDDRLFETVAKRWIGYMKGKRAPHN